MVVVAGYLIATGVAVLLAWATAGRRYRIARDPSLKLGELGSRHVTIIGGLAGFAVTAMVLLVTLGRNSPDASGTGLTTVLILFLIAYMGYFASGSLFANMYDEEQTGGFDAPAAVFAGAAVTLYFTVIIGWVALRPMFQAFGLTTVAELAGLLLPVAVIGGYGMVAQHLWRCGYATGRIAVAVPLLAVITALVYSMVVGFLGLRTPDAQLNLTVAAFLIGAVAFFFIATLPFLAHHDRTASFLSRFGPFLILAYCQGTVVVVAFLVLAMLGLA